MVQTVHSKVVYPLLLIAAAVVSGIMQHQTESHIEMMQPRVYLFRNLDMGLYWKIFRIPVILVTAIDQRIFGTYAACIAQVSLAAQRIEPETFRS